MQVNFELIDYYLERLKIKFYKEHQKACKKSTKWEIKKAGDLYYKRMVWFYKYELVLNFLRENPDMSLRDINNSYFDGVYITNWLSCFKGLFQKCELEWYKAHLLAMIGLEFRDADKKTVEYFIPSEIPPKKIEQIIEKTKPKKLLKLVIDNNKKKAYNLNIY